VAAERSSGAALRTRPLVPVLSGGGRAQVGCYSVSGLPTSSSAVDRRRVFGRGNSDFRTQESVASFRVAGKRQLEQVIAIRPTTPAGVVNHRYGFTRPAFLRATQSSRNNRSYSLRRLPDYTHRGTGRYRPFLRYCGMRASLPYRALCP
jgi:hypothetical protein